MTAIQKLLCPGCGTYRRVERFGITEDFTFEPEHMRAHELQLRTDTFSGRGRLAVERTPLTLPMAQALRASLAEALRRLDAEIATATSEQ